MLPKLIRHSITLHMEIVSMVAEEIQQRAEAYVQSHSDEAYEAFLNQIIGNLEKTVDFVALPMEQIMKTVNSFHPASKNVPHFPGAPINWNDAVSELQQRIQELKKNLQS